MHSKNLLKELAQRDRRREAVLVFRGTGFNIWHYLPFLRNFSLNELSEFQALYAVSGASLLLWLYCLIERGTITDSVAAEYDTVMRRSARYGMLLWTSCGSSATAIDSLTALADSLVMRDERRFRRATGEDTMLWATT